MGTVMLSCSHWGMFELPWGASVRDVRGPLLYQMVTN